MTDETKNEDGLAAMAGAQVGEDITEEQMKAEGADNMTEAQAQETIEKATQAIKADHIASAIRGLAQGFIAAFNENLPEGEKVDQAHTGVRIMEPALDLLYFMVQSLDRAASALEKMADAQAALAEQNGRMTAMAQNPPIVVSLTPVDDGAPVGALSEQG